MILQLTPQELQQRLVQNLPTLLVDVREPWEHQICALPGDVLVPMSELQERHEEIRPQPEQLVVCYCHHGVRSLHAAAFLQMHGLTQVASLRGGIEAWAAELDPQMPRY